MTDEPVTTTNPYEAPNADIVAAEPGPVSDLTREEVDAFVGDRGSHFWGKWRPAMKSGSLFAGFSWAAAFFNVLWFLYRKMYREFGVALLAPFLIGAVGALVHEPGLERISNLALVATCGALGNGLYLRRARLVVADARRAEPELERRLALLRKKGGTSILWPLLVAALLIALSVAAA
jgi:hypothetical protein